MEQELTITIKAHDGMTGVVILRCNGRQFQFADMMVESGPWFKIPSRFGPTFIDCDSISKAVEIVTAIMRGA
ncbi:MAG: hypothetical protein CMI60_09005 [Parvibaculum sp.]|nr:hypothetical protein [Parvibaculum sp.]